MGYGWKGERVQLVPLDREKHLDNFVRWFNDPDVLRYLGVPTLPMTRESELAWFDMAPTDREIRFAVETLEGEHIGSTSLFSIDWPNRTAYAGTVLGPEHWSMGYGSDVVRVRSAYAFQELNLRVLFSSWFEGNFASGRMLEKVGFLPCGCLPKIAWKNGQYRDENIVYLTRESWESTQVKA